MPDRAASTAPAAAGLPAGVRELLGPDPQRLAGWGRCATWRGAGRVAKVGPGAAREAAVLSGRVGRLPLATPAYVDEGPCWVVMAEVPTIRPTHWPLADVPALLADLAALHDAFAGAAALTGGPLDRPLPGYLVGLVRLDVATIDALPAALPPALRRALADPAPLLALLAAAPCTLVHGDPWPGNVRVPAPGRRVWLDWEDAVAGPAGYDVAAWLLIGPWSAGRRLDRDAALAAYVAARRTPVDPAALAREVDAATVLLTVTQDLAALHARQGPAGVAALVADRVDALHRLGLGEREDV